MDQNKEIRKEIVWLAENFDVCLKIIKWFLRKCFKNGALILSWQKYLFVCFDDFALKAQGLVGLCLK